MGWRKVTGTAIRAAVAFGAAGVLLVASPAYALDDPFPIELRDAHKGVTAEVFGQEECDGPFKNLDATFDGWHFVLPMSSGQNFETLEIKFDDDGTEITVSIDKDDTAATPATDGSSWKGWIAATGSGKLTHAYVITLAGWTLLDGDGTAVGAGAGNGNPAGTVPLFNLSHVCAGDPDEGDECEQGCEPPPCTEDCVPPCVPGVDEECTPTEPPTTTTTTTTTGTTTTTKTDEPGLPVTGSSLGGLIAAGVALVAGGAGLLLWRRRRDITDAGAAS